MIFVIIRKELHTLFYSPLAWVLLALVQLSSAWAFFGHLDAFLQLQPQLAQIANAPGFTEVIVTPVFALNAIVVLMLVPLLTMRQFAGERKNHTLVLLLSAPVSITEIVLGKFFGLVIFFLIAIVLNAGMVFTLSMGGTPDSGLIISGLLGLFLLISSFVAVGLYISSLTAQPVLAAAGVMGVLLSFWVVDMITSDHGSWIYNFSIFKQFELLNNGLLDSFSIIFFCLFTIFFLVMTIHHLDGERLHG